MDILFVLVPVSVIIVLVALVAFIWSVNNDQFEDLEMEAERILLDDNDGASPNAAHPEADREKTHESCD